MILGLTIIGGIVAANILLTAFALAF